MKTEGSNEQIAYMEAKKKYLAIGKHYSALLSSVMKLDPNILQIAEEIMITGDGLSAHDNRFLTTFYNELKTKSKIDKKYYDLLLELKKTRNELDHATHELAARRIGYLLRKSGIPPKRLSHGKDAIVAAVNNPDIGLLEKLSLPDVLNIGASEKLEDLITTGEIDVHSGSLTAKTKSARDFVKNLESGIQQKVNNDYFLKGDDNLLKSRHKLDTTNILDFVRISADSEHIREIERRLESKDIELSAAGLVARTAKGQKYLTLLIEELSGQLDRKLGAQMLERNRAHAEADPRLARITSDFADLDISLAKHSRVGSLAQDTSSYQNLLAKVAKKNDKVRGAIAELLTLQETIAVSFADIKKQLVAVLDKKQINIDRVIALMLAVRYLSVYENKYEAKLCEVESILGIIDAGHAVNVGPVSINRLAEMTGSDADVTAETDATVRDIIANQLASRKELGDGANETLVRFMLSSPQVKGYRDILTTQQIARKHIVDTLYHSDCLYRGFGNISEILAEITELELEKKEKMADLIHELELAHKELWLAQIVNNNSRYIDTSFAGLPDDAKIRAKVASKDAVKSARSEIRETLAKYRNAHKKHSNSFAEVLRKSLQQISKGEDVSRISAELKKQYRKMSTSHEELMRNMEKDVVALEKRLLDFEERTPAEIEKLLMSDIRATI